MIVDSSALVAIAFQDPGYDAVAVALARSAAVGVGTPTLVETGIVLRARLGPVGVAILLRLVDEFRLAPVPFGDGHWREALRAFERYGKPRHPAALNFGDCMTYAIAKLAQQPLLCVGHDFARTDLVLV